MWLELHSFEIEIQWKWPSRTMDQRIAYKMQWDNFYLILFHIFSPFTCLCACHDFCSTDIGSFTFQKHLERRRLKSALPQQEKK